jgi:DNA-directed RNA polymerase subunit M/transcription elongation factor TFIIS
MITNNSSKIPHSKIEYYCEMCEYKTRNKKDYNKHILTSKHQKNVLLTQQRISLTTTKQDAKLPNTCDLCNKCYGSRVK